MIKFPKSAPCANPVFYRTYSRIVDSRRESLGQVIERTIQGLVELGKLEPHEVSLLRECQEEMITFPSGRWMWVGGTDWSKKTENFPGAYNCSSQCIRTFHDIALMMDLAMQGCGTGAVLESRFINQLPTIVNELRVTVTGNPGNFKGDRRQKTFSFDDGVFYRIVVGDSREGWVSAYHEMLLLAADYSFPDRDHAIPVLIDLSHVRPEGEPLKGFGGVANPNLLGEMFPKLAKILNGAIERKLNAEEVCLLIDEASKVVVAGNIRRSAGMRQFDAEAPLLKLGLWKEVDGEWKIDPDRDALRMANHTRVYHSKPTEEECIEAVRSQFHSGEGAIMYAPEAIARGSIDLLNTDVKRKQFIQEYEISPDSAVRFLDRLVYGRTDTHELTHRMTRYGLNPCGEIIMRDSFCNLSEVHLNQIDPFAFDSQSKAFKAAAISVAALLHHEFVEPKFQRSRNIDPIVGVSFTGLFDFFVHAFGADWLKWWEAGRSDDIDIISIETLKRWNGSLPDAMEKIYLEWDEGSGDFDQRYPDGTTKCLDGLLFRKFEQYYLEMWRNIVHETVWEYCDRHNLKRPNRCTTVQPAGTKSLLTGASAGWHPPKSQRFIRRITFAKNDPVALACVDFGYSIVPSQSDKDENGVLLNDPFDPRCTEWLVEIPTEVSWANIPGADSVAIEKFSALAQIDFYLQVQRFYTRHNTSATIEVRENEIEELGSRIYQAISDDEGYISACLLARFDSKETYPRLPFEPINKETYDRLQQQVLERCKVSDFHEALMAYDSRDAQGDLAGPAGCDSDKCLLPVQGKN